MGRWFSEFLGSQGYSVVVADPGLTVNTSEGRDWVSDWRDAPMDTDLIVVATPIKVANEVLQDLAARKPSGVVFDIGSLKTPLRTGLTSLRAAGVRVTSIHPMFGPGAKNIRDTKILMIPIRNEIREQKLVKSMLHIKIVQIVDFY